MKAYEIEQHDGGNCDVILPANLSRGLSEGFFYELNGADGWPLVTSVFENLTNKNPRLRVFSLFWSKQSDQNVAILVAELDKLFNTPLEERKQILVERAALQAIIDNLRDSDMGDDSILVQYVVGGANEVADDLERLMDGEK